MCLSCIKNNQANKHAKCIAERLTRNHIDGEEWRSVPGFSKYEASSLGRLRGCRNKNLITPCKLAGYLVTSITNDEGKCVNVKFHRVVALAFLANPDCMPTVNHIDKNRHNNRVDNLEWQDQAQQMHHRRNTLPLPQTLKGRTIGCANLNDLPDEEWRAIGDDSGKFISNCGRLKYKPKGKFGSKYRISTGSDTDMGYKACNVHMDGRLRSTRIHVLVAKSFLASGNEEGQVVNHKDGNKANNHVDNLEWLSRSENTRHAYNIKLIDKQRPIVQLDAEGQVINKFKDIASAESANGLNRSNIFCALKNPWRKCGGFHWIDESALPGFNVSCLQKPRDERCKPVRQLDRQTRAVVAEFDNVQRAVDALYKPSLSSKAMRVNICKCASGTINTAYGFAWEYT